MYVEFQNSLPTCIRAWKNVHGVYNDIAGKNAILYKNVRFLRQTESNNKDQFNKFCFFICFLT